ncbi:MAG: hypothetical protein RIR51_92 [Bacteroidota bacterium]
MKNISVFILLILGTYSIHAQTIHGMVMSLDPEKGMADLPFANVYFKPLQKGILTDERGNFSLDLEGEQGYIIISAVGFQTDSLFVPSDHMMIHLMPQSQELTEVFVSGQQGNIDRLATQNAELLSKNVILKAACCNLSESFETNTSVSVSYNDAVTGTKQIQFLGLSGKYIQTNIENMPGVRGLKTTFGMNYIPGTWINSIQLSKGQTSVLNGYESISGAINVELEKPDTTDQYYFNTYLNSMGRFEMNNQFSHKFSDKFSGALYIHNSSLKNQIDQNSDGFLDLPSNNQTNIFNRWKYMDENWVVQFGGNYINENRLGGQTNDIPNANKYQFGSKTERGEAFAKIAKLFQNKPYKGIGLILQSAMHKNDSYFGINPYVGTENSFYGNLIYQNIIGNTNHTYKTGISYLYDEVSENYLDYTFSRIEKVPGIFYEYSYTIPEKFNWVIGNRVDFHNNLGTQWVPRTHIKWDISRDFILRASAGKGWRRINYIADNYSYLANQRTLIVEQGSPVDIAWNYGIGISFDRIIGGRKANFLLDYYSTQFTQQWIWDMETINQIHYYLGQGKSYSNAFQLEINYSPIKRFDLKASYRLQDVKADYGTGKDLIRRDKPFISRDRVLVNLAYFTTESKWKFDYTFIVNGRQRVPVNDYYSPNFTVSNFQVTRSIKKWEIYWGGENIFGFKQSNPILNFSQPYSPNFDATMIWGPIYGAMYYSGLRFRI